MKKKLKIGIWLRIAAFVTFALLLFALIMWQTFGTVFYRNAYEAELNATAEEAAARVSSCFALPGFSEAFRNKDLQTCGEALSFLGEYAEIEYLDIWIVANDTVMVSYNEARGMPEFDEIPSRYGGMLDRLFSGEQIANQEFSDIWNRNMFGVGTPVYDESGQVIAAVLAQIPNVYVKNTAKSVTSAVLFSLLVALVPVLAWVFFSSSYFTKPLVKMKRTAETWMRGDYAARVSLKRGDEIGDLAEAMDVLAGRLEKGRQEREESEKARYQFFADVSHELKTPVTVLRAQMEMLRDGIISDQGEVRECLAGAVDETKRMQQLVEDLLTLAKMQSPEFTLNCEKLCLAEILTDLQRSCRAVAEERGIPLVFHNLCKTESGCIIQGDYTRVRQMIMILIDNALKFTPRGGTIEVELRCESAPGITVRDNGCGIPEEEQPHVFDRFYTHYNGENPGSGLGLPLAKQIADRHNAKLQMQSEAGAGTEITILFPKEDGME